MEFSKYKQQHENDEDHIQVTKEKHDTKKSNKEMKNKLHIHEISYVGKILKLSFGHTSPSPTFMN